MLQRKKKKKILFGPVITILIMTFVIMLLSLIMSKLQLQGEIATIENGYLASSLTIVNNIFTLDGLKFLFGNVLSNFQTFEPLVILVVALIGISIGESSGLFDIIFKPLKKLSNKTMMALTIFTGIISSVIGDYNYLILIPLVGVVYTIIDKNAYLGILTLFIGMTIGYGTGIIYNDLDYVMGNLTQISASLEVDKNYTYNMFSNIYIMVASTIILTIISTTLIDKFIVPKLPKYKKQERQEVVYSKKGLYISNLIFIIVLAVIVYMIIPGFPNSGLLLDKNSTEYIDMLFGDASPFKNGFVYIVSVVLMLCGFVYGKISGNIKNTTEYSLGLSKSFSNVGFVFVLMFFTSQMISILDWTNIGPVIVSSLTNLLASLPFSGIILIITFFIIVIIMTFVMPSTLDKWVLLSPLVVPLFMRANITPDFTLFIYKVADGIGKCFSPLFVYFLIMLAFLEKYNSDEEYKVTVFGTIKSALPVYLLLGGLLLLIIVCWYLVGLPSGIGTYPTL